MKTRFVSTFALCLLAAACGSSSPAAPTAPPQTPQRSMIPITYAVNIPDRALADQLAAKFPNGFDIAPVDAQRQWDYTGVYGCPNAYLGPSDLPGCTYRDVGIAMAPFLAASKVQFTAADWPGAGLDPQSDYRWLARFVYVGPAGRNAGQ